MPRQPNAASRNRRAPSRKCRARRVKCRARPLTTLSTLKTLPTRRARKPPREYPPSPTGRAAAGGGDRGAPRPVIVRGRVPKHPPYAGHDSRARFGRPKASSLIPLGARIAGARFARAVGVGLPEAKPSREAVARGRAEAARCGIVRKFAGRSCAASSLSSDKGATPAGGGKPSAADSEQTCLTRNCRARFWAASPPALPPTSREIR